MNKIILLFLFSLTAYGQVNLMQSSPNNKWKQIEDERFRVIYPDYTESKAYYILNLLNHYQESVSKTYDIIPKKLTVILRSELSVPNGFVTLGPRRSEWFTSASITPFVGSLDWYQSLAIHEYRHVVQLDYLNRSNVKIGSVLFGDSIGSVLVNIIMPGWYFEGDAVWTETVLSNAGRGRSPRFSNRLKALVTSGQLPKYDDLLAGDYTTELPNLYVYGYFLITRANRLYGKKVWKEIAALASDSPLNPFAFYNSFYYATGTQFDKFFNESMLELQKMWGEEKQTLKQQEYITYSSPIENKNGLYYLKKDLDSYWGLYKRHKNQETKIDDFNVITSLSKVDISSSYFAYTQILQDSRYSFKGYSDLFIYDFATGENIQVTKNKRIYHPNINPKNSKEILALEYTKDNKWVLQIFDLRGAVTKTIPSQENFQITEAIWKNENELIAFTIQKNGMKQITQIDLLSLKFTPLTQPTRNNLYSLAHYEDAVYFEADDKGVNNILKLDLIDNKVSRCTHESIAAHHPSIYNGRLSYVSEGSYGKELKQKSIGCELIEENIFNFENYLSKTPSDNYHQTTPVTVKDYNKLITKKSLAAHESPEMTHSLTPHSWSFIGGRGYEVSAQSRNYLNTFNLAGTLGISSEEEQPYSSVSVAYSKYYPIYIFQLTHAAREQVNTGTEWSESIAGLDVLLPYLSRKGLYNLLGTFTLSSSFVSITDNDSNYADELNGETLLENGVDTYLSWTKSLRTREIKPSLGITYAASYKDFKTTQTQQSKSYYVSSELTLYLPGLMKNNSFSISSKLEYRPDDLQKYHTQENYTSVLGYTFSRGFAYQFTPKFTKTTLDYTLPLAYPKWGLGKWIYLNRIYGSLFLDHTLAQFDSGERTMVSRGLELYLESLTMRKFPLRYGIRVFDKVNDQTGHLELFVTL